MSSKAKWFNSLSDWQQYAILVIMLFVILVAMCTAAISVLTVGGPSIIALATWNSAWFNLLIPGFRIALALGLTIVIVGIAFNFTKFCSLVAETKETINEAHANAKD